MLSIFLSAAMAASCPPTKTNIITPLTLEDMKAMSEWKQRCLDTKSFICLEQFIKKDDGYYLGFCSLPIQDKEASKSSNK